MRSDLFAEAAEVDATSAFTLQNAKMLKVSFGADILARQGSMVAYQGALEFAHEGAGMSGFLKQSLTGESLPLMRCSGQAEGFFAVGEMDVSLLYIENDRLTLNSHSVLAFETSLTFDIVRVEGLSGVGAHGLFNVVVAGTGWVAITTVGQPLVLEVSDQHPTFVDANAAIAWSAGLRSSVHRAVTLGAVIGRGSGEGFHMRFEGEHGVIVVQA